MYVNGNSTQNMSQDIGKLVYPVAAAWETQLPSGYTYSLFKIIQTTLLILFFTANYLLSKKEEIIQDSVH